MSNYFSLAMPIVAGLVIGLNRLLKWGIRRMDRLQNKEREETK